MPFSREGSVRSSGNPPNCPSDCRSIACRNLPYKTAAGEAPEPGPATAEKTSGAPSRLPTGCRKCNQQHLSSPASRAALTPVTGAHFFSEGESSLADRAMRVTLCRASASPCAQIPGIAGAQCLTSPYLRFCGRSVLRLFRCHACREQAAKCAGMIAQLAQSRGMRVRGAKPRPKVLCSVHR